MYSLRNQPFADSIYRPITTQQTQRTKRNKGVSDREKIIPETVRGQRDDNTTKVYQDGEKHPWYTFGIYSENQLTHFTVYVF